MTPHWSRQALQRLDEGRAVVLISIVGIAGSTPRESDAKIIVSIDTLDGTIGGGALEHQAIAQARALLGYPTIRAVAQDYPLGAILGQCCGGRVRLALEALDARDRPWLKAVAAFEDQRRPYVLRLSLDGEDRHCILDSKPLADKSKTVLHFSDEISEPDPLRSPWLWREEFITPLKRDVIVIGGGHVGNALAMILSVLPLNLTWLDSRPDQSGPIYCADPVEYVRSARPDSAFLIMTHDHALDFSLCEAILRRGDALLCGVIGSRTKRARFLSRLDAAGLPKAVAQSLVCPIGQMGLRGKEPGIIAVAVATELMLAFETAEAKGRIPNLALSA